MIERSLLVASLLTAAGAFADVPAERATFLGWHESGAVSYQSVQTATSTTIRACRQNGDDVPAAWPPALAIGPGVLCADLDDATAGAKAADFVKHEISGGKNQKASPFGLKVELAVDGAKHTITVSDGPGKQRALPVVEHSAPLKLGDVVWRKDGAALAVALESTAKADKGAVVARVVVIADVADLLVGGPAGKKVAQAKEKEAQALLKKRDWSGAGRVLDDAIAADGSYAPVRYLRAAAEAQGGIGRTAMIENLQWLKSSTDAEAKRLLEQAKKDPVFDAWVGEPEVRELLAMPPVSTMDVPARLLERKASWALQGTTCKSPWFTLSFAKGDATGGKGTLEVAESCRGKKSKSKQPFAWQKNADGGFDLVTKPLEVGGVKLPEKATLKLDDTYQQLKLVPGGDADAIGTFEPGVAQVDDSV